MPRQHLWLWSWASYRHPDADYSGEKVLHASLILMLFPKHPQFATVGAKRAGEPALGLSQHSCPVFLSSRLLLSAID